MSQRSGISDFPSNCKSPEQPEPALDKVIQGFSTALNELKEIIKELTSQKEMEAAAALRYKTRERHYQELFDGAPNGCLVTDSKAVIQESNRVAANLLQTEPGVIGG